MLKCDRHQDLMMRYFDHNLSEHELETLDQHLDSCPSCRLLFSQLSGILTTLESAALAEPQALEPPADWERLVLDRVMSLPVQPDKDESVSAKVVYGSVSGIAALLLWAISLTHQGAGLADLLLAGRHYLDLSSGMMLNLQVVYQIAASLFSSEIQSLFLGIRNFFFFAMFLSVLVAVKMVFAGSTGENLDAL